MRKLLFLFVVVSLAACARGPQGGDVQSYVLQWQTATGASPQAGYEFDQSATDTAAYIVGTAKDTSKVFQIARYQAATISLQDTAASGTAAAVKYVLYVGSPSHVTPGAIPAFSRFARADEFTVGYETTHDTLWVFANYGPAKYGYIEAEGQAGNNSSTATQSVLRISVDVK